MTNYPTYKLGEILSYEQPTNYIVESTEYDDTYPVPVLTAGKSFILGYTNETKGVYDKVPVIIFDDFTTASKFVDFKFKVKSSAMKILSCDDSIADIKYMYYLMQITHIQSDTHKRYWISDYSKIPVSLPPLPTQHQIVSRIESLFAELDKAVEHLRTAQQQLKIYRQAVLNHWLNNEDGKWELVKLGEVAEVKRGRSKHRPRNDKSLFGGKYPFIQTGEIREAKGGTITTYSQTYSEKGLEQSRLWPKGTLCLTIAANIAETAYLGFDACFPDSVVGIIARQEHLNLDYFNCYIQLIKQIIEQQASATAQKNINVDYLENLQIPLPPLPEQQHIVKEIESRLSQAEATEARIAEASQKTEALRQSILKKAFGGKLV